MTDSEREQAIEQQRQIMVESADAAVQRVAFERMRELIGQRSPERVAQMERDRGLRAS